MTKQPQKQKVRFINPPNKLKAKVGSGGIDTKRLEKAQDYINNNKTDFIPHAGAFLEKLTNANTNIENNQDGGDNQIDRDILVESVMQLKANGGMFKYQLVSDVADICLNFVENLQDFNADACAVVKAHENTIKLIMQNKLTGDGGAEGTALLKELDNACERYFTKYQKKPPPPRHKRG